MISYFYNKILNIIFSDFNNIKVFLYLCNMIKKKTLVESLFHIHIKMLQIEALSDKVF